MNNAPDVHVIPRKDFPSGWKFYCIFCKKYHLHGEGLGHRVAHCFSEKSPYYETGYNLVDLRKKGE